MPDMDITVTDNNNIIIKYRYGKRCKYKSEKDRVFEAVEYARFPLMAEVLELEKDGKYIFFIKIERDLKVKEFLGNLLLNFPDIGFSWGRSRRGTRLRKSLPAPFMLSTSGSR